MTSLEHFPVATRWFCYQWETIDHNQKTTRTEQRPNKSSDYTHLQGDSNYTVPDFGKLFETFNTELAVTGTSPTPNANLRNNRSAHL